MSELQAKFEEWCATRGFSTHIYGGQYLFHRTRDAWFGFCREEPVPALIPHQDEELLAAMRVVRPALIKLKENPKAEGFANAVDKILKAAEGLV